MRYYLAKSTWAVPATIAVLAMWGVSALANWDFGASRGSDHVVDLIVVSTTTAQIFSIASLAADILKTIALFAVANALAQKQWRPALVCACIFIACTGYSIISATGFVARNISTVTDLRGQTATEWSQLQSQIDRLEERRQNVVAHRPESVVKAEIDALLMTPGADGCSSINGPVTQTVCPKVAELRKELGHAKSAEWLDGRLEELRAEVKQSTRVTSEDPWAEMLASMIGYSANAVREGQAIYFALMLEFISSLGIWAIWTPVFRGAGKPLGASKEVPASPIAEPSVPPALDAPEEPETTIKQSPPAHLVVDNTPKAKIHRPETIDDLTSRWMRDRADIARVERGMVASDLHADYSAWCRARNIKPVNAKHFGRSVRRLSVKTGRGCRGVAVYGLRLRASGVAHARAA